MTETASTAPPEPRRQRRSWARPRTAVRKAAGRLRIPERRRDRITDVLVVLALAALNSVILLTASAAPGWAATWPHDAAGHAAGVALALLLPARRRNPLAVLLLLVAGGLAAEQAGAFVWGAVSFGVVIASYSIGRYLPLVRALAAIALATAADAAALYVTPGAPDPSQPWWTPYAFALGSMAVAWWLGRLVRLRAFDTAEVREHARRVERARDAHARAVLAEERSRIARELHDVVAHHVSVMTVQATAGRRVIARSPERAEQTLAEIERTGRETLAEMRRIVGVLRMSEPDRDDGAARSPQPGVADIEALLVHLRDAGVEADLRVSGSVRDLPPVQSLTVYRVVQESLTNVLKHAGPGARARVGLAYRPGEIAVEVTDDGAGHRPATDRQAGDADAPGHGILGMRERTAMFGGELDTGPLPDGGFRVSARIPLHDRG
ncbi:sensor histidine kinase [Nocardiopsis composta]|uniref:histidine kinase n=1 Tax=Nocardiopsis composta TaxID=157465 RepID=A0A7W8VGT5_9ACTN|nr:sensor histidine kinase [Nocardiopsis composta]MBB5435971.1 signal transduction histidine kinase [Nocardiopsis composta]